jgi:medium-chain acyl-[acyl-carrier-protein] hydrolase
VTWFDGPVADSGPVVVVLSYAGAVRPPTALVRNAADPGTSVAGIILPGHGTAGDALLDDPEQVLSGLAGQLQPLLGRRLTLVGFSLGARLAFELARRFTAAGQPPGGLVCCVARAPHTGVGHLPTSGLDDAEFQATAIRLGLLASAAVGLNGIQGMIAALRADLRIVEHMPFSPGSPPLDVRTTVIGASSDWLVPDPVLRRWADLVAEPPLQLRVPGGHLSWLNEPGPMVSALARGLQFARAGQD